MTISGTTATVVYRGSDADDPVTEVSGNKKAHRRGASVVITDFPILAYLRNILNGDSGYTIPNLLKYASGVVPVSADDLTDKGYVDALLAGVVTTVNVVAPGTAGETVAAGNLIYFDDTDNEWKKSDADTTASVENTLLAIAQGAGVDGGAISGGVLLRGLDANQTGLTAGAIYYASNTAGGISSSAGTKEVAVGFSYSTTQLYFNPRFNQQLTEDEQDALVGTSGTPSSSNKFVTNDDTATAATASKVARRLASGDITVPSTPTNSTDAASKAYADTKKNLIAAAIPNVTSSVADTNENTLITVAIPANTLGTANAIRVKLYGLFQNGANAQTLTLRSKYGSTTIWSFAVTSLNDGSKSANFVWEVVLYANAATNSQRGRGEFIAITALTTYTVAGNPAVLYKQDSQSATEDSTGALNLLITTQLGGTTNAPTITVDNYTVEILKSA